MHNKALVTTTSRRALVFNSGQKMVRFQIGLIEVRTGLVLVSEPEDQKILYPAIIG